jgi:hypothetical protein
MESRFASIQRHGWQLIFARPGAVSHAAVVGECSVALKDVPQGKTCAGNGSGALGSRQSIDLSADVTLRD